MEETAQHQPGKGEGENGEIENIGGRRERREMAESGK